MPKRNVEKPDDILTAEYEYIGHTVFQANEDRSQKEFDRSNSSLQLLVGVVSLIGLVALAVWLAKRTHRYLNLSLGRAIVGKFSA